MERPELTATRTGIGWRLPAPGVVAVLLAVVGVARWNADLGPAVAQPTAVWVAEASSRQPSLSLSPSPTGTFIRIPAIEPTPRVIVPRVYADGIPLEIGQEPVERIPDALAAPIGRTLLVGGWHKAKGECAQRPRRCPVETMADTQLDVVGDLSTVWIALDRPIGGGIGPRVVRAIVEVDPRCSIRSGGECQPRLRVLGVLWTADHGPRRLV